MYRVNFRLAQYFREILYDETVASEWCPISVDESLSEIVLKCEMEIIVWFLGNL